MEPAGFSPKREVPVVGAFPNNEVFGAELLFPKRLPEVFPNNPPAEGLSPFSGLDPKRPVPEVLPPNKLPVGFVSPPNKLPPAGFGAPPKRLPKDPLVDVVVAPPNN